MRYFILGWVVLYSFLITYIAVPVLIFLILSYWSIQIEPVMGDLKADYWRNSFFHLITTAMIAKTFICLAALFGWVCSRKKWWIHCAIWFLILMAGLFYFFHELQNLEGKVYTAGLFRSTGVVIVALSAMTVLVLFSLSEKLLKIQWNLKENINELSSPSTQTLLFFTLMVDLIGALLLALMFSFYLPWIQGVFISLLLWTLLASFQFVIQLGADWQGVHRPWLAWQLWIIVAATGGLLLAYQSDNSFWPYFTGGAFFLFIIFILSLIYGLTSLKVKSITQER